SMNAHLSISIESWKLHRPFTISRGTRTAVEVCLVTLEAGGVTGRGESTPYARYRESPASVQEQLAPFQEPMPLEALTERIAALPAGAARNALDCAWWDWRCKRAGEPVATRLGWPPLQPIT